MKENRKVKPYYCEDPEYTINENEKEKAEILNLHFNFWDELDKWLAKDEKNEACGNYVYLIEENGEKDMISFWHFVEEKNKVDTFFPEPFCVINYGNHTFDTEYPQVIWSEFAKNGITLIERYNERDAIIKLMNSLGFDELGNVNYSFYKEKKERKMEIYDNVK